jgi:hypothetical protein
VKAEWSNNAVAPQTLTAVDTRMRAACLQRLATALTGYCDLSVTVRADGPAPCLAALNIAVPELSETVTVTRTGDDLAFLWSWGERIADASDPDSAAQAVAYVLSARDAQLRRAAR